MAQLKQDEWPKDREPTTQESQVENREKDQPEKPNVVANEEITNVEPDQQVD